MTIPLRVLIIEDSDDDLALILRELRRADFEVLHHRAQSEAEIREALSSNLCDAIICDDNVPGIDSPQALAIVKEIAPHLPFLLVSGSIDVEKAIETVKAGADDYIPKDNLTRLAPTLQRELTKAASARHKERKTATAPLGDGLTPPFGIRLFLQDGSTEIIITMIGAILSLVLFLELNWSERLDWINGGTALLVFIVFVGIALGARHGRRMGLKRRTEIEMRAAQLMEEVAKRGRIEQSLLENNQTFRTFIHTTPLAVISLSLDRKVQLWNAAAERMFGWTQDDVLGKVLPLSLEGSPDELVHLRDIAKRDVPVDMEITRHRKDGSPIELNLSIAPLRNVQGRINGTILVLADITERKYADAQILKLNRDLENYAREMKIANEQLKRESEERAEAEETLRASEAQYRLLAENVTDMISVHNPQGDYIYVSPVCVTLLGYEPDELIAHSAFDFFHAEDVAAIRKSLAATLETPSSATVQYRLRRKDGRYIWVETISRATHNADGAIETIIATTRDIRERKRAEQILHDVNRQLATSVDELQARTRQMELLGEMSDALQACSLFHEAYPIVTHFVGQFFPANLGALYLHDSARKILEIATTWGDVSEQYLETIFASEDCWALRRGQVHHVGSDKDGLRCKHAQHVHAYVCIPMIAQGETIGVLHLRATHPNTDLDETDSRLAVTVSDQLSLALANLRLRDELRQQAIRDPLTKLFNRRYMEETLVRELSRAERNSHPVSVIMIDIDHFKDFNDIYGHEAGDLVLQTLAKFLGTRVRGSDVACRFGGEEFILILPSANLDLARKRAEQIRESIQSIQVKYGGQTLGPITLSLGVAVFPEHGVTSEAILQLADAALYRAKQNGRNRVVISSE
jgi:diguanylate cyclase (GGDEF)-like protein/PAS domain S-box-containing protein